MELVHLCTAPEL